MLMSPAHMPGSLVWAGHYHKPTTNQAQPPGGVKVTSDKREIIRAAVTNTHTSLSGVGVALSTPGSTLWMWPTQPMSPWLQVTTVALARLLASLPGLGFLRSAPLIGYRSSSAAVVKDIKVAPAVGCLHQTQHQD
jgi:hypothetical protein